MTAINERSIFDSLFRTYHHPLYRYALSIVGSEAEAEDVVEDIFVQLWSDHRDLMAEARSIKSLLYKWTRNRSIDRLRHRGVVNAFVAQQALMESVFDEMDESTDNRFLWFDRALASLPPQTRRVFESCMVEGRRYQDTADMLGISVNTVKSLMKRALSHVRSEVRRLAIENGEIITLFILSIVLG